MNNILRLSIISLLFLTSCKQEVRKKTHPKKQTTLKYANYFSINKHADYKKIVVHSPWGSATDYATYYLVSKTVKISTEIPKNSTIIRTPINNIAILSTPHLGLLKKLNAQKHITAIGEAQYIYDENIKTAVAQNKIKELGAAYSLNIELLLSLKPNILFATGYQTLNDNLKQASDFGIPIVYTIDWMEKTPLARAEWLKFVACFTEQEVLADSLFNEIEARYLSTVEKLKDIKKKPSVLVGQEWKGVWNTPGGNSYFAQFLKDAGAAYYWFSDNSTGSLALSFEDIYDKQSTATLWLNPGQINTIAQLISSDERLTQFNAVQNKQVYGYFNQVNNEGANAYWENGGVNPHLILSDLIKILHPEVLPEYELYYYRRLE